MNDLLLITDMARLSRVFDRLADDNTFTLRVVNNLEKGGEEIAIKKPDVVFVQTHLSGLSADILLKHLKKQLGRKRSRFVLLGTPGQVSNDILKPYQGWLDISCKDGELAQAIQNLLTSLLSKTQKPDTQTKAEDKAVATPVPTESVTTAETSAHLNLTLAPTADSVVPGVVNASTPVLFPGSTEASLEDQGITYSPRPRLSVYSEFNNSFDNAVKRTPEPESLVKGSLKIDHVQELKLLRGLVTPPHELETPAKTVSVAEHEWNAELIDNIETVSPRSKRSTFLLWLAPVVVIVVVVTFLQKNRSVTKSVTVIAPPTVSLPPPVKTAEQPLPEKVQPEPSPPVFLKPAQDSRMTDKAVITAITENRGAKSATTPPTSTGRPSILPDFIPRYGLDKQYGISNPGWERYKGQVTEFKVFREGESIKAIQVVDRGGQGVPESFMKGVLRQVAKKPVFTAETTEKKEGYEIQRGEVSSNLSVVYYRDEQGGRLRAFVMTWR